MPEQLFFLWYKYKSIFLYAIFGIITTVINVWVYHICYRCAGVGNIGSTIIAWFFAVLVAFFANKLWVFESKTLNKHIVLNEAFRFFGCRIGTGIIEIGFMYVFVDVLHFSGTVMKLIANFVVIVLNYILSKLIIFRKK